MNLSLPPLPFWQARSFYAQLLLAASVLLNSAGIDLMAILKSAGFGATPDEVIARGVSIWQALAPIVFGLWAWFERRAPNYRLTLGTGGASGPTLRFLGALGLLALMVQAVPAQAQTRCLPFAQAVQVLHQRYGEELVGTALAGQATPVLLCVNPDSGSWTLLASRADGTACILIAGQDWVGKPLPPDGEPT